MRTGMAQVKPRSVLDVTETTRAASLRTRVVAEPATEGPLGPEEVL